MHLKEFLVLVIVSWTIVEPLSLRSLKHKLSSIRTEGSHDRLERKPNVQNKRIVKGVPMHHGQWPWLVSLHFLHEIDFTKKTKMKHVCGGTIINSNPIWVLTAAHCVSDDIEKGFNDPSNWNVVIREYNQYLPDADEKLLKIDNIYIHPNFSAVTLENDIALIKLETKNDVNIEDVADLDEGGFLPGQQCSVAGWGQISTAPYGIGMYIPLITTVNLEDVPSCKSKYKFVQNVQIDDSVVCAGSEEGHDSCMGDSGGPLMCLSSNDSRWKLIGVVSSGNECGHVKFPGIYTRISYFAPWIDKTIFEHNHEDDIF